jgi:hypothetical protein
VSQPFTAILYASFKITDRFAERSINKPLLDETRTPSHSLPVANPRGGGIFSVYAVLTLNVAFARRISAV